MNDVHKILLEKIENTQYDYIISSYFEIFDTLDSSKFINYDIDNIIINNDLLKLEKVLLDENKTLAGKCIRIAFKYQKYDLVKYIIDFGIDINILDYEKDKCKTPLYYAVYYDNIELVDYLLSLGAKIDGYAGSNSLSLAFKKANIDICQKLLDFGGNIDLALQYVWISLLKKEIILLIKDSVSKLKDKLQEELNYNKNKLLDTIKSYEKNKFTPKIKQSISLFKNEIVNFNRENMIRKMVNQTSIDALCKNGIYKYYGNINAENFIFVDIFTLNLWKDFERLYYPRYISRHTIKYVDLSTYYPIGFFNSNETFPICIDKLTGEIVVITNYYDKRADMFNLDCTVFKSPLDNTYKKSEICTNPLYLASSINSLKDILNNIYIKNNNFNSFSQVYNIDLKLIEKGFTFWHYIATNLGQDFKRLNKYIDSNYKTLFYKYNNLWIQKNKDWSLVWDFILKEKDFACVCSYDEILIQKLKNIISRGNIEDLIDFLKLYPNLNNNLSSVMTSLQYEAFIKKDEFRKNVRKIVKCIKTNDIDSLKVLLTNKELLNFKYNIHLEDEFSLIVRGANWLHIAAIYDRDKIAELLIKNGVDVNTPNYTRKTPLYYASKYGSLLTAKRLIDYGAFLDGGIDTNILKVAISHNNLAMVNLLLENNADPNITFLYFRKFRDVNPRILAILTPFLSEESSKIPRRREVDKYNCAQREIFDVGKFTYKFKRTKGKSRFNRYFMEGKGVDKENLIKLCEYGIKTYYKILRWNEFYFIDYFSAGLWDSVFEAKFVTTRTEFCSKKIDEKKYYPIGILNTYAATADCPICIEKSTGKIVTFLSKYNFFDRGNILGLDIKKFISPYTKEYKDLDLEEFEYTNKTILASSVIALENILNNLPNNWELEEVFRLDIKLLESGYTYWHHLKTDFGDKTLYLIDKNSIYGNLLYEYGKTYWNDKLI